MSDDGFASYYGRPILKEPVWKWQIPAYFFFGGLGGASGTLSGLAKLSGNEPLAKASAYLGAAADTVSPALLVADLGRPERFLNMFRVFKVTSPMSVGSWLLAAGGAASGVGALLEAVAALRPARTLAHVVAAALGPAQCTYTAAFSRTRRFPSGTRRAASCRTSSPPARRQPRGRPRLPCSLRRTRGRRGGSPSAAWRRGWRAAPRCGRGSGWSGRSTGRAGPGR